MNKLIISATSVLLTLSFLHGHNKSPQSSGSTNLCEETEESEESAMKPESQIATVETLSNTSWKLMKATDSAGEFDLTTPKEPLILSFLVPEEDKQSLSFAGGAAVNRFFGGVIIAEDGTLTLGPAASTRRMGPPPLIQFENRYLKALSAISQIKINEEGNLVLSGEGITIIYIPTELEQ